MVNSWDSVYVERAGKIYWTGAKFHDDAQLRQIIDKIVARVGRRVDETSPYVDARLPDGSRVNAIVPPLAIDGACLTIRKFSADPYGAEDLVSFGTLTKQTVELLDACVRGRLNILVSGGTGAGKTTTLNVLSSFLPDDERILTIEDSAELRLQQPHVVRLEYRPPNIEGRGEITIRDLVRNALRMRPDRIVVGEVRGGEALDMMQAMNTGHDGSITTIHANSPRDALSRVETMMLMSGMDIGIRAIREQISLGAAAHHSPVRMKDGCGGSRTTEIVGMEGDDHPAGPVPVRLPAGLTSRALPRPEGDRAAALHRQDPGARHRRRADVFARPPGSSGVTVSAALFGSDASCSSSSPAVSGRVYLVSTSWWAPAPARMTEAWPCLGLGQALGRGESRRSRRVRP
jgi:Flp pilus assembly CpaF family ATPase